MASTRMYEDLCEILNHELDTIARKGDIDKDSLDDVHKLASSIAKIKNIMKDEKEAKAGALKVSNDSYAMATAPVWNQESMAMRSRDSYGLSNAYARGESNAYAMGESNARRGGDGDRDGRYSEEAYARGSYDDSYRRGRDMRTGRYVSRDPRESYEGSYERGYSRHTARERMIVKLEEMMDTATNERDRQAIMRCVEQLEA